MHFILFVLASTNLTASTTHSDTIVVTASALPETVESTPAAVTVVTREEIDQRAARDVADLLREVPGIAMSRTGSQGRATSLFTRGSNSTNHTLVLWNGVEITNPYFAGYDWGRFSTSGVEQVEVVRGPFSALYGSDAVAGVVNVLTTPRRSGLRASAEAGENGLRNGDVTASLVRGASHLSASFESRADDGFATNDDFEQQSANVALRWQSDTFILGLTARHTSYDLGIPMNTNALATALVPSPDRRQDGTETQVAVPIEQILGDFSYELTLAHSRREDHFEDPEDPFGQVDAKTDSTTRRARLTTRWKSAFGTIVAGGEYERAEVEDLTNFGSNLDNAERTEKSLFAEDRYTRQLGAGSRLEISAGFRYDDFDTFGSETSPRIAAAWISGANKLRAGFGEAFRAPAVGELYFPFFGNATLEAERSRSWEVGYDRALASGLFAATFFRSDFEDLIVFDVTTNRFGNVGAASAQGVELSLERELMRDLRASLSYTYTDTEEESTGLELLRRPRHAASLFLGWHFANVDANVVVQHTGARADFLAVAPFSRITNEAFTTIDANMQLRFGRITPFVKIENATDIDYEEVSGYPSPSRRASIGIRFAL